MKEIEYIQVGDYQLPNLKVEEMPGASADFGRLFNTTR